MNQYPTLGSAFKRALLIEDSIDICDFYKDFFEAECLPLDILTSIPSDFSGLRERYDVLICDWLVGHQSARSWINRVQEKKELPRITIIATGLSGIEEEVADLPVLLIYKPFDVYSLKDILLGLKENLKNPS